MRGFNWKFKTVSLFLFQGLLLTSSNLSLAGLSEKMVGFVKNSKAHITSTVKPEGKRQIGGSIPYTFKDGKAYLLLGMEASQKPKYLNTWCGFVGSRDPEDKTLLDAILRETYEETSRVFNFPPSIIDEPTTYSFFKWFERGEKGYLFIYLPNPTPRQTLIDASERQSDGHFKEKSDFMWISFPSKPFADRNIEVVDIEGKPHKILLRDTFLEDWNTEEFQSILADINERAANPEKVN